ncbi:MAG TPA: ABC transporter permease [Gemmatimonadaceae bacterium]|nr:ABC transporter permease [Gemmatimonadaceae bacterium]
MRLETFHIAFAALRANWLRSLLTMLGIVIGVAAVIAMIALGNGAQRSVRDRIERLGTTTLQINAAWIRMGGVQLNARKRLTRTDAEAIEERSPHVLAVEPQQDRMLQLQWGDKNTNIRIVGATPNFAAVRKFSLAYGRMFNSSDNLGRQRVAVLGAGALTQLGVTNPFAIIGQKVRIGGVQFTVIGTLKEKGAGNGFGSDDDQVFIPFFTGRFRLFKTDWINDIFALASSEADVPRATTEIDLAMRRAHHLRPDQPDDFRIRNRADFLQTLGDATKVFTTLLAGIAAVSLLVGGIGIMNIMLVSVTERTREIGIRKALGATRFTIMLQFLVEAVSLSLVGGGIGVAIGFASALLMRNAFGWNTALGPTSVALAFAFASAVGVVFGVWPARRAAALDPIEALRYE